ncbi:MAG: GTP 3',8-cyclase MoaA [Methanobrevibacter sp.]|jgi:cyclic pyranopterin phosphate synthase|nr:GTP 3',8-cyclase MoaA [Candidatus Methanovirga aequatorialis]
MINDKIWDSHDDELIFDSFNRPIISIRISLTNGCNFDCIYCHHDGMLLSESEMNSDEIYRILKVAKKLGVKKVRFSGGEPLLRNDIVEIIGKTSSLKFKDISITTNGVLLDKYGVDLIDAGLNRVNVSLDTLNPNTYKFITKRNCLDRVKSGILHVASLGLYPIKINMVVMSNLNDNEICDMFKFCEDNGLILQLIELMRSDHDGLYDEYHFDIGSLEEKFEKLAYKVKVRRFMQDRKKYYIGDGEVEIVKPMDNTKFCKNCSRIRITPEGFIKPCLLKNNNLIDIIGPIRNNLPENELEKIFLEGINNREPYYMI